MMKEAGIVLTAFLLMEPVTYLAHRFIFHGFGFAIHESHHKSGTGILELNDLYPLSSACITMAVIAVGIFLPALSFLIPVGFGMTAYGMIYFFIHDLVIHRRAKWLRVKKSWFRWHYRAHRLHHLLGGEPYGLVLPVLPRKWNRLSSHPSRNPS